ncbi:MAG: hypothetical protein WA160_16445 [Pseudobdellovibrio sp.]
MNKKYLAVALIVFSCGVHAQEDPPPDVPIAKPDLAYPDKNKKIQLNFSDELVHGNNENTDVMLMNTKKSASMKKLIRLRDNFNSNMEKSKNEFKNR